MIVIDYDPSSGKFMQHEDASSIEVYAVMSRDAFLAVDAQGKAATAEIARLRKALEAK